ncbi:Retinoblastoma-related protein [Camellia lanceoleosa]|uniref:Retinoblastoma-related protein n=1 Tax=Camellia lanceoleosa TaxID=1840588 RepID=A0ACC0HNI4_9ERIC|nr:Retinoblastoma-related protein [Camellia lanceoleosa]
MHKVFVKFVFPSIDGLIYFKDLLEDTSLSSSLNILENDYADATRNKSELDERVFVNKEDSLLGSVSSSGGAMNISGAKRKIDSIASPTRTSISPLAPYCSPSASHAKTIPCGSNSKVKATPITTAMTTAKVGSSHCCYQLGRLCT